MPTIFQAGHSIEGIKVHGQSRKPLKNHGLALGKKGDKRYYIFIAQFDVKSNIVSVTTSPVFCKKANITMDSEIRCDRARLESFSRKYSGVVSTGSSTHKTNFWDFSDQTCVRVEVAHQELLNALNNSKQNSLGNKDKE